MWHSEDELDGEVYEINWEEPVSRLRFGRYIMIVRDKLGDAVGSLRSLCGLVYGTQLGHVPKAAEVMSFVLDNGKLKVGQVIESLAFEDPKRTHLHSSAHASSAADIASFFLFPNTEVKKYRFAFHTLVDQKYLKPCTAKSHISPRDRLIQHEAQCKRERANEGGNSILTPKDLVEIKMMAAKKIHQEEEEADALGMVRSVAS